MKLWIEGCHQSRLCWGYDLLASVGGFWENTACLPIQTTSSHCTTHRGHPCRTASRERERDRTREPWRIFEPHGVQITMLNHCQVAAISLSLISAASESNDALWQWKFPLKSPTSKPACGDEQFHFSAIDTSWTSIAAVSR